MPGSQNSKSTLDFLSTIGSKDRGDQVTLSHTAQALVELAEFLISTATDNLDKKGNTATGDTISSMVARQIQITGTKMELDVEIKSTYKFLDQGVRGTEGGTGRYSFKTARAGKRMAMAIKSWLKVRRIASNYKAMSKNEAKNKRIKKMVESADGKLTSLSYAIATSIKKKGIKPTKFFTNAVRDTKALQKKKYADALKLDIIESLNLN